MMNAVPAIEPGKTIRVEDLPESVRRILAKVAPTEWAQIGTVLCRSPFMIDLVQSFRFLDAVWHVAAPKEHRIGVDRITGAEMDNFRGRVEQSVKAILDVGLDLASRARLTKIQEGYLGILSRYGFRKTKPETKEKPPAAPVSAA